MRSSIKKDRKVENDPSRGLYILLEGIHPERDWRHSRLPTMHRAAKEEI